MQQQMERTDERLLRRYLEALLEHPEELVGSSPELRTCATCGDRTRFRLDAEGGWASCTSCGALA